MRVRWDDNFEALYRQRGGQKRGIRLLALWKIQSGMSQTEVSNLLHKTQQTIRFWRDLYEEGGVDALLSIRSGRGRKAKISDVIMFSQSLEELTAQRDGGRIRCQDIVEMMKSKHQINYSIPGMYHVLRRFRYSWITARSKHPSQNLIEQEAFKKTL